MSRANPFLEIFCQCCLPQWDEDIFWYHPQTNWKDKYLVSVKGIEIGMYGRAIDDVRGHGTGFFISFADKSKKHVEYITEILRDCNRRVKISKRSRKFKEMPNVHKTTQEVCLSDASVCLCVYVCMI